jgi:Tfp pilus assembly protein PilF
MGKKEEAKKSYQKSLKLNPKNENAIKVLKELS